LEAGAKDLAEKAKLQASGRHLRQCGGSGETKDRGGAYSNPARRSSQDQKADQECEVLADFKKNCGGDSREHRHFFFGVFSSRTTVTVTDSPRSA
jgi:hypothetical protein